jgi:hypothetical protein
MWIQAERVLLQDGCEAALPLTTLTASAHVERSKNSFESCAAILYWQYIGVSSGYTVHSVATLAILRKMNARYPGCKV